MAESRKELITPWDFFTSFFWFSISLILASVGLYNAESDEDAFDWIFAIVVCAFLLIYVIVKLIVWIFCADELKAAIILNKCLVAKVAEGAEIVLFKDLSKEKTILIPTAEAKLVDVSGNKFKARVASIKPIAFCGLEETVEFVVDPTNMFFSVKDGVLFSKDGTKLLAYPKKKPGAFYAVPESVRSIGAFAFDRCEYLEKIVFPRGLLEFADRAFTRCGKVVEIEIPESAQSIGELNFSNCQSLTRITISEKNEFFRAVDGVLFSKDGARLIVYPAGKPETEYDVSDDVVEIAAGAFIGVVALKTARLSNGIKTIADATFRSCFALEKVVLPNDVERIGKDSFMYCKNLKSVAFPNSLLEIGPGAFSLCGSLVEITFPKGRGLKKIGDKSFLGCASLESIDIPEGVLSIGDDAFKDCVNLRSVEIPTSATVVSESAFEGCKNVRDVYMPTSLKKQLKRAFPKAAIQYIE